MPGHAHDVGHQLIGVFEGGGTHALKDETAALAFGGLHIGAKGVVDMALAVAQRARHLASKIIGVKDFLQKALGKTGHRVVPPFVEPGAGPVMRNSFMAPGIAADKLPVTPRYWRGRSPAG